MSVQDTVTEGEHSIVTTQSTLSAKRLSGYALKTEATFTIPCQPDRILLKLSYYFGTVLTNSEQKCAVFGNLQDGAKDKRRHMSCPVT